ncbi:MAG: SGNH/GDSL hydrolase family protein, partial [candidate division Zixibacteria bacterium]|nr:SGNH/GDSL hydrolase family protein [candidate division Zixibacteria bacterium]
QKGVKRVAMDDFGNNLKEIESLCRQNGIEVLILTLPVASIKAHWGPGKTSVPHLLNQAYNNAIRQLAVAENYRALDIAALFYDRADLYDDAHNDYIHYNARGHQLVARVIFDYITAAGFLSRTAYAGQ